MKNDSEIWKDVEGYEGIYQVSSLGQVRSLDRIIIYSNGISRLHKGRYIRHFSTKQGYRRVGLSKSPNGNKNYSIHRLVAIAFIPNPYNLNEINHKNEIPHDNRVENLEWCNSKYNNNYGTRIERIIKSQSIPVNQYSLSGEFIKTWNGAGELGRNGFTQSSITRCCNGILKTHRGFKWRYADEINTSNQ